MKILQLSMILLISIMKKINKLNNVKQCIISRNNTFDQNDTYYYSIVKSYISSYDYTALQYDNKKDETTMDSSQLAEVDTEKKSGIVQS